MSRRDKTRVPYARTLIQAVLDLHVVPPHAEASLKEALRCLPLRRARRSITRKRDLRSPRT